MIISNLSVPLVGAVDTAVVGHLPELHHIGAVALGALIFSFLYWGFGFLKMGITGFVARAYGANHSTEIAHTMLRFLGLAVILGLGVIMLREPLVRFALHWVDSTPNVERLAADYSLIRIWSAPATLCVYVFTGIFVGLHQTRRALALQLVLNATNIALDWLFVPVLHYGVAGVAWATLMAEYTAVLYGFWLLRHRLATALATAQWQQIARGSAIKETLVTNGNIFIRTICLVFCFAFFTAQSARQGELVLAVNVVLLHFQTFAAYGLDGFAHAMEALGGSAFGAGDRARFRRAVRFTTSWAFALSALISIGYLAFGSVMVGWFSNSHAIQQTATDFLLWVVCLPLFSTLSFQLDGLFIGVGHARPMRDAMLLSTAGYLAMAYWLPGFFGNHGLFLALSGFMLLRAITLAAYYPAVLRAVATRT